MTTIEQKAPTENKATSRRDADQRCANTPDPLTTTNFKELTMATRNHIQTPATAGRTKQNRFLTVSLTPGATPRFPWIRLRGQWLQDAGFAPQTRIRVRILYGCLVITAEDPPP
jgi:hypothetical protein